ncbi:MAG: carbamoyltransferase [bacterium]|nr:carbamoyltransferase [bacterium]
MIILGIGGILNDAACAILDNGKLSAAVEQNKVARRKRPGELPEECITSCLKLAGAKVSDVDCVAIVRPLAAGPEAALHMELRARFPKSDIVVVDHQAAHAASAFYASPFEKATVLTLDRAGDFRCGARWRGAGSQLQTEKELYYPDSLGDLYGRVTALLGFQSSADEHKLQWLSASGGDQFQDLFLDVLSFREDAWPRIDRTFLDGERLTHGGFGAKFYERLGLADGADIPAKMHCDVAAGLQRTIEKVVAEMAGSGENLCLAGGLHFNVMLVEALEGSERWKNVFVQPAAGNSGTALGAVFHAWHNVYERGNRSSIENLCLGPSFTADEIKKVLENCKLRFRYLLTTDELIDKAVDEIRNNRIIAWMHGRMEFGPRALGNRSILASPLNPYSTENLNTFIKHREPFRKFAASVPEEVAAEYFEVGPNARFLATVGRVRDQHRKTLESALLGSDRIRVHTVRTEDNPLYWRLLHAFGAATGLPILYNTSFNLFGDPLVCTPRDAVRSFYSSGIDSMFVGNFFLEK